MQVRERFCTPLPQRTLQGDQSVHDDQPPFTVCTSGYGEKDEYKCWKPEEKMAYILLFPVIKTRS